MNKDLIKISLSPSLKKWEQKSLQMPLVSKPLLISRLLKHNQLS
jgi:hypothetical protein